VLINQAAFAKLHCDTSGATIEYRVTDWFGYPIGSGSWSTYTPGAAVDTLTGYMIPGQLHFRATKSGWTTSDESYVKLPRG
jgi:hypothetical protein